MAATVGLLAGLAAGCEPTLDSAKPAVASSAGPFMDGVVAKLPRGSLICTVERKSVCDRAECKASRIATWAYVNLKEGEYATCDHAHCNAHSVLAEQLSAGTFVSDEGRTDITVAHFAPGYFEEVRFSGLVIVSSGTCRPKG